MIGIGIGIGFTGRFKTASDILGDTTIIASWLKADDLTTITKDGSNLVSSWRDKNGTGHDLAQVTGASQPLWITPGTIRFDGIDDSMFTGAFTWVRPLTEFIIVKGITSNINLTISDGLLVNRCKTYFGAGNSQVSIFCGSALGPTAAPGDNTWFILKTVFNGANSLIQINQQTPITGNSGTSYQRGGFTLGARGSGTDYWANVEFKEYIAIYGNLSENDSSIIYNYLLTRIP